MLGVFVPGIDKWKSGGRGHGELVIIGSHYLRLVDFETYGCGLGAVVNNASKGIFLRKRGVLLAPKAPTLCRNCVPQN